ncbi:hypothetical protein OSB04_un001570 [Centaurea solstitialis]|uniref:Pectinesterase inhibitor domain-containing protein n=1 Tax=Centaurea solstitialis TaxID=347529 RepID=A0AA38VUJ7_9ASTR|nr:hypothetical protein OSB04_un001570 [Centaurea solstitialis]
MLCSFLFLSIHAQTTLIHGTCEICSQQDPLVNYQFCITSLQDASGSRHADIRGLGKISIKLTQKNLTDTRSYIKNLLKNNIKKLNSYVKMRLEDCLELYSDSIADIKRAMDNYKSKHYHEANIQLSSVMEAATTCENGFKEKHKAVTLLTKRNNATFELSVIGLSIMRILQNDAN